MKKIRIQKFSMKHLFSNNKFLFVISILIAIVLWMVFVLNSKNEVPQTINNVPIHIDTSGLSSHLSIIDGADPVSYTHLDVYKRQVYGDYKLEKQDNKCQRKVFVARKMEETNGKID